MKVKSTLIIALSLLTISVVSMFLLREVPVISPWKNWKVLSVDIKISEQNVLQELSKLSISNVVTESSQKLNTVSRFAPVLPSEFNFYKDNINRFFYDKNQNYRLYYVPKSVSNKVLKKLPFEFNIDLQSSFPYFSLIISIIALVLLIFLLKNKLKFMLTFLPFIIFTLVFPSFNSLIITLFCLVIIYFLDKYDGRNNPFSALFMNIFVILSICLCIIVGILSGFRGFVLLILTVISSCCIFIIFTIINKYRKSKNNRLNFVYIVSAKNLKIQNSKTILVFYALSAFVLVGALSYFLIPSIQNKTVNNTPLFIPTPLEYNGTRGFSLSSYTNLQAKKVPTEFPDLGDYVSQVWNAKVYPYIPLKENEGYVSNVKPETYVKTTEYFEENGTIKTVSVEIARFSKQFIDTTLEQIKNYDGAIIEKVLMDQESFCATDFGNVKRTTSLIYILFIISLMFCGAQIFIFYKFYK